MKRILGFSTIALLGCMPLSAVAQDEPVPQGYSYVTYYICDMAEQGNMDNIVENNEVAVFAAQRLQMQLEAVKKAPF